MSSRPRGHGIYYGMKKTNLIAGAAVLFLIAMPAFGADVSQAQALERAKYYEATSGYHTLAFRELVSIIEGAVGNYDGLLQCVEAVYSTGSNTPSIVALASDISRQRNSVPHFDRLLTVARFHMMNSVEVRRHIADFVEGRIDFQKFDSLTKSCM